MKKESRGKGRKGRITELDKGGSKLQTSVPTNVCKSVQHTCTIGGCQRVTCKSNTCTCMADHNHLLHQLNTITGKLSLSLD